MSTILEALRKLQAEREQPSNQPKELRSSLVERSSTARSKPASGGVSPVWIGAACGGAVVLAAASFMSFWPSDDEVPDPLVRAMQAPPQPRNPRAAPPSLPPAAQAAPGLRAQPRAAAPAVPPPSSDGELQIDAQTLVRLSDIAKTMPDRERNRPSVAPPPVANRMGNFTPPNGIAVQSPAQRGVANVVRQPAPERPPAINFQPPAPSNDGRFEQPEVPPYVPPPDRRQQTAQVEQPTRSDSYSSGDASGPRSVLSGSPSSEPSRTQGRGGKNRSERVQRAADADSPSPEMVSATSDDFPKLQVESVQWHPDPSLRRAVVLIDGVKSEQLREGDLFEGLFIDRIEPGSVDFRLGGRRTSVKLGS